MSGQREAHFLIQDTRKARQLRERRVAERIQALFSVHLSLAAARAQGEWVTLRGSDENTEKAKKYILSLCTPEMVRLWQSSSTSAQLLFSETSRLRDDLEREFQTVILPSSSSPGCIHVQGSQTDVHNTLLKIASLMTPLDQDHPSNTHRYPIPPSPPPPSSSVSSTAPPQLPSSQSTCTYQPHYPPTTTAGSFPALPPLAPSLSSTQDQEQQLRNNLHQMPGYAANRHKQLESEKQDLLRNIATDIERDGCGVVPRGLDTAQREQTIQYFVSLNFPREKTEAVINSIGWESDYDDILQRLVNICSPPSSHNVPKPAAPRPRSFTGEAVLESGVTLRPVVIDGSNVAMRHGNGRVFSCKGIELAVQWFKQRGHQSITVFVPQWRREPPRAEYPITDQDILNQLEVERTLVFTPSRRIGKKNIVCYDDRFIVRFATETGGVIVSNDNFRDLTEENDEWRKTIEQRLIMFTFVNDMFMVAEDPLGRHGPSLNQLLQMEPTKTSAKGSVPADQPGLRICPYAERCTFGKKCRYYHPEREGRTDSVLSARSAAASPAPERRLTGGSADLQKDLMVSQSDQASSGSGRRSKSPQKSLANPAFPSQLGPDSRIYVPQDPRSYHQEFQGYAPAPQGYLQPHREYCQPQEGQSFVQKPPHYLGLMPATNGALSNQPTSLLCSPRQPTPTTPMGTYTPRTFPIANLSLPRPRNMTDSIQTDLSPLPSSDYNTLGKGGKEEDGRALMARPPTSHPIPPPHQQPVDPLPGLVPRGDYSTPYHSVPSVPYNPTPSCDVHQYDRTPGYPQHSYYLHSNAYPTTNSYLAGDSPPNTRLHHSPARSALQNGLPAQPALHGGSGVYPHSNRHSAELSSLPENQLYTAGAAYQRHSNGSYQLQSSSRRQSMPIVPDCRTYPYLNAHSIHVSSSPSTVYVGSGPVPYPARGVAEKGEDGGDGYRNSFSAPELNRSDKASSINWSLFKKAQAVLPDHEERIMNVMLRYPHVDLEELVHLVQQS